MELFLVKTTNTHSGKEYFLFDATDCESYEYESGARLVGDLIWDGDIDNLDSRNPIVLNKKQKDLIEQFLLDNNLVSEYSLIHGIRLSVFKDCFNDRVVEFKAFSV